MQTGQTNTHWEKTIKASDFFRALLSIASSVTAEMHDIKITAEGDIITAYVDDARITIAPREPKEGGAA